MIETTGTELTAEELKTDIWQAHDPPYEAELDRLETFALYARARSTHAVLYGVRGEGGGAGQRLVLRAQGPALSEVLLALPHPLPREIRGTVGWFLDDMQKAGLLHREP